MDKEPRAVIFDIERYATKDGPGIRTVIFFKGCNLRGVWCQNPESQHAHPEIMYYQTLCQGCGRCLDICPQQAIRRDDTFGLVTDPQRCTACGACVEHCYVGARKLMGRTLTVSDVMTVVRKDAPYYARSGGGVTFSGGEPLLYPEFVKDVATCCQAEGIHTALETAGHVPWDRFEMLLPFLNLIFFDLKHIDPDTHKICTGVTNTLILENLNKLSKVFTPLIVRIPVIPGYNDAVEVQQRLYAFVRQLKHIQRVELLPYHRLGSSKYTGLGREYSLQNIASLHNEDLRHLAELGRQAGIPIQIGAE